MDAAMVWGQNGKTYFVEGDNYWRHIERNKRVDDLFYPRWATAAWGREFRDLDAAVTWKNGQTYIFNGTGFYEYDNFPCGVKDRNPQNTLKKWLGC